MDIDNLARKRSEGRQAVVRIWGSSACPIEEAAVGGKLPMEYNRHEATDTSQADGGKPVRLGREHVRSEGLTLLDAYALLRARQELGKEQ